VTSALGGSVTAPKSKKGRSVVSVERAPTAVGGLHADEPVERAVAGCIAAGVAGGAAKGQDHLCGVVDVGVVDVLKLESPAAWRKLGPADRPVADDCDLFLKQPVPCGFQSRVVRWCTRIDQCDSRQSGVPHRGLACLDPPAPFVLESEGVQARDRCGQDGVVERVALQHEGDRRVDHGRLDPTPAAIGFLAGHDPAFGFAQGRSPDDALRPGLGWHLLVAMEGSVESDECPAERAQVPAARLLP